MSSTQSLTVQLKQAFAQLIADRIGVTLRKNDQASFEEFIFRRLKAIKIEQPEDYYWLLQADREQSAQEWKLLILEITNTESFFFRDTGQFKLLKNYILPKIIEQKSGQKTLRICSAGCSTGEEPYSIAILLKELISELDDWDLTILGVDVNTSAIQSAQQGLYRPWSFRGVDKTHQQRFFHAVDNQYQINDDIKQMVDFQLGNLLDDSLLDPFATIKDMDLILCRNVFIYFSSSAIEKILNKIYDALCPLGYLLVGHTELYSQNSNKFHIKMFEESIAYQRPLNNAAQPMSEFLSIKTASTKNQPVVTKSDSQDLSDLLKGNDIKMHKVALDLLRQLPGDSRIAKLGNRTASELISQLENTLKETD